MKKSIRNMAAITALVVISAIALVACAGTQSATAAQSTQAQSSQAQSAPAQSAPAEPTETAVLIPTENYDIPAVVTKPGTPAPESGYPFVIMLHGTASEKDEAGGAYARLCPMMAEAGIASIRFDFPGNGESTADYSWYSNSSAVNDVIAVLGYAVDDGSLDMKRIGIMGWSQGGTDALLAAGLLDGAFRSVLTWAGARTTSLETMYTEEQFEEALENGYFTYDPGFRAPLNVGIDWFIDLYDYDVDEIAKDITVPLCSIHGSLDDTVPVSDSEYFQSLSTNPQSRLEIIEGTDHLYGVFTDDDTYFLDLAGRTIAWFLETL